MRFYPQVSTDRITVTGTPQFDFHRRPGLVWSRQKTLERLWLPPGACYFLYTTTTQALAPAEPDLVARIARRMAGDVMLGRFWLVVRTHPMDDWARWNGIPGVSDRIVLSHAWVVEPDSDRWAVPTPDDQARYISSLAHAEACLNIASTATLDAAILDRPAIGIRFEHESDAPREILYEEYDADHYRPLVESGGVRVALNWSELMDLMRQAVTAPDKDRTARECMVARECGIVDGRAAQRTTDALLGLLARTTVRTRYD
jgi:hypothetical protein